MNDQNEHLKELAYIRSMMEQSSRFISLSGLSGVAAGIVALMGAAGVYIYLGISPLSAKKWYYIEDINHEKWGMDYLTFFSLDAFVVLVLAIGIGYFFSYRKAKKAGQKLMTPSSMKLLSNFLIPLISGGIFCLMLARNSYFGLVAPSMLIFYGLALINGSKYTLDDIRYLGYAELFLGLLATWFLGFGLLFWAIGFGVLHIVYGMRMYWKYDRD
ncbi:MAG: hypothetical protein ACI94Y_003351 [Maribacter sp.]|jgi:hypothetical protein